MRVQGGGVEVYGLGMRRLGLGSYVGRAANVGSV